MKFQSARRALFTLIVLGSTVSVFPQQLSAASSAASRNVATPISAQSVPEWRNIGVFAVAAGFQHTCAIEDLDGDLKGSVFCWGKGGQLGDGVGTDSSVPVPVAAASGFANTEVTQIAAGVNHTCAVERNQIWCWGEGAAGRLGNGADADSLVPVKVSASPDSGFDNDGSQQVPNMRPAISAGSTSTCVIIGPSGSGQAYCWGDNTRGQLGNGSTTSSNVPKKVSTSANGSITITDFKEVSVGFNSACAIADASAGNGSSSVFCWGFNNKGEIGDGTNQQRTVPTKTQDFVSQSISNDGVYRIEMGGQHSCAVVKNPPPGSFFCWGEGTSGRLGNSAENDSTSPVTVTGTPFTSLAASNPNAEVQGISAGQEHTCGDFDYKLFCWGANYSGQLGNGSSTASSIPVAVAASTDGGFTNAGGRPRAYSSGTAHTCAVSAASFPLETLYCWGENGQGQLGIGNTDDKSTPVKVLAGTPPAAPTLTAVTAGDGQLTIAFTAPSSSGSAAITNYEVSTDNGSTFTPLSPASITSPIVISGLQNGTTYQVVLKAVNSAGAGSASQAMPGTPTASTTQLTGATASAVMTSDGVVVTFTGIPAEGPEAMEVKVGPTSEDLRQSSTIASWWFGDGPRQENPGALPTVTDGSFTVTIPSIRTVDYSSGPAEYGTEAFTADGEYHLLFGLYGETWEYVTMLSGDPVVVARAGSSSSGGSSSSATTTTAAPASGGTTAQAPSLVTSANQEQVAAPAGSAKLLVNGELVEVDLVQAPEELRRTVAGARTFAEVRALQVLAQDMVAAVQAVLGDGVTLPITVQNTSTGATITGVVSDPVSGEPLAVPVEDVLLIVNESIALMVGGADGAGDPANIAFDGVLEFGEGGYVAVLAYGLTPGAAGEVVVMSTPRLLDTFAVGTDGGVAVQTQIPTDLEAGDHTVVVAIDGQSASLGFRVLAPGILPSTGGDSTPLPWAVLVLAAGAFAVLTVTRRRTTV